LETAPRSLSSTKFTAPKSRLRKWIVTSDQYRQQYKHYFHNGITYQKKGNKLHQVHPTITTTYEPIDIPKEAVPAIFTLTT
jgi:hypothetical protein